MDSSAIFPAYPGSGIGFSDADIANSISAINTDPSIPAIPSLSTLAGGLAGSASNAASATPTGTTGTSSTATGTPTSSTGASPANCRWYDIGCWGGAILGRVGIVILGMIFLGVALWMLADKQGISIPVPVPV